MKNNALRFTRRPVDSADLYFRTAREVALSDPDKLEEARAGKPIRVIRTTADIGRCEESNCGRNLRAEGEIVAALRQVDSLRTSDLMEILNHSSFAYKLTSYLERHGASFGVVRAPSKIGQRGKRWRLA